MDNQNNPAVRPETATHTKNAAQGLDTTVKLMENYLLLREYAQKGTPGDQEMHACDPGAILDVLRRSREDTAVVVNEIDEALAAIRVAALAGSYYYKVEAFERHYIQGQTYEHIADAMNSGRNSPARWCKEIMRQMSVRLFGVNGIGR